MKDFLLSITKKIKNQNKKIEKVNLLFFIPFILVAVLFLLYFYNKELKGQILKAKILASAIKIQTEASYPVVNSVLGAKNADDDISSFISSNLSAKAAIVLDDDSKVVLFSKNETLRFSMASTTKIMTALTAIDYYQQKDVLTVKTDQVEGVVVGFKQEEKFLFEDLLYAMLLPSGNDAALAIAQNYPGGGEEFVKKMNEKAKEFNLYNTHYQDPAGLFDTEDYTTVIDLARLSSLTLKNKTLSKIVATEYKKISNLEKTKEYDLYNLNKLLGINGVDGVKTGFTEEAEGVLVTSRIKNGHRLIIVVMKSKDRFLDTQKLLDYASSINYIKVNN